MRKIAIQKLNEIKDDVAVKEGYNNWQDAIKLFRKGEGPGLYVLEDMIHDVARDFTREMVTNLQFSDTLMDNLDGNSEIQSNSSSEQVIDEEKAINQKGN